MVYVHEIRTRKRNKKKILEFIMNNLLMISKTSHWHYSKMRKSLLHRLKEIELTGKILDIIKSIYKSLKVSLIHQDEISQTFFTTINLKQGDALSTILFNIYINDLPGRLLEDSRSSDTINDIPYLDDTKINNLLFADDLAIFSLSKEDLQKKNQC